MPGLADGAFQDFRARGRRENQISVGVGRVEDDVIGFRRAIQLPNLGMGSAHLHN